MGNQGRASSFFSQGGSRTSNKRPPSAFSRKPSPTTEVVPHRPVRSWVLTHLFRIWTALLTVIGIGWSFLYKPEWLTWWLRTTTAAIEKGCTLLPYPWGDRVEIATRGIGASFWVQITLAIIIVRVIAWMMGYIWRHSR
jgi:hypothetical protein